MFGYFKNKKKNTNLITEALGHFIKFYNGDEGLKKFAEHQQNAMSRNKLVERHIHITEREEYLSQVDVLTDEQQKELSFCRWFIKNKGKKHEGHWE